MWIALLWEHTVSLLHRCFKSFKSIHVHFCLVRISKASNRYLLLPCHVDSVRNVENHKIPLIRLVKPFVGWIFCYWMHLMRTRHLVLTLFYFFFYFFLHSMKCYKYMNTHTHKHPYENMKKLSCHVSPIKILIYQKWYKRLYFVSDRLPMWIKYALLCQSIKRKQKCLFYWFVSWQYGKRCAILCIYQLWLNERKKKLWIFPRIGLFRPTT